MPTELVIRPAREDNLAAVLRLWMEAEVTPPSVSNSMDGLTRLVREPNAVLIIAIIEGRLVGSVIGGWDGWRDTIYRLAVAPAYRRKGIETRLVEEINRAPFDKGAERLSALVKYAHPWAIAFWEPLPHLGYERDPKSVRYTPPVMLTSSPLAIFSKSPLILAYEPLIYILIAGDKSSN
jgi:ribosomal protein S18 acetylase RimI-like enzyme